MVPDTFICPKEKRELKEELPAGMYFEMGTVIDPDPDLANPILDGAKEMFFTIIIRYSGPSTKGHESQLCWRLDQMSAHFVSFGGEKYNYIK